QKYCACAGWISLELSLIFDFPHYLKESNFIYPIFIILAIPFVYITVKRLINEDYSISRLTYAISIAYILYAPFATIERVGNWLIGVVVSNIQMVLDYIGFDYHLNNFNVFYHNSLSVEIILGCTGIQAIVVLLGLISIVPSNWKQKVFLSIMTISSIFIANVFRNVYVIMAYTEQWHPWFQDQFSNPLDASFFWSHNVICEVSALIITIVISYIIFKMNISTLSILIQIINVYYTDMREIYRRLLT
ncbi:MAG TPA: archaeosortase A, partial [Methanocorpusculum sp.]|nr:archaeosortase A [Methanocorpusculum sp.]